MEKDKTQSSVIKDCPACGNGTKGFYADPDGPGKDACCFCNGTGQILVPPNITEEEARAAFEKGAKRRGLGKWEIRCLWRDLMEYAANLTDIMLALCAAEAQRREEEDPCPK